MKYEIGDKVRVKKDLETGKAYGINIFGKEMEKTKGKIGTICYVGNYYYNLNFENSTLESFILDSNFKYTDEMLEPVKNVVEEQHFSKKDLRFGDVVILRRGSKTIFTENKISNEWIEIKLDEFNEDLKIKNNNRTEYDIIKVQRPYPQIGVPTDERIFALYTEYERKEEILNKEEKEYLKEIMNIFSTEVYEIERDDDSNIIFYFSSRLARQPMDLEKLKYRFKNMEENHKYTLEELDL